MAYQCSICHKGVMHGHNVSHAKNRTNRVFLPSLRTALIRTNGKVSSVTVCMKCLKRAKLNGSYVVSLKISAGTKNVTDHVTVKKEAAKSKPTLDAVVPATVMSKRKTKKSSAVEANLEDIIGAK